MKISEIINESENLTSAIDSAETIMAAGWDSIHDGEFVSYKKLEIMLAQINNIVGAGITHPQLSEAILEINSAASAYLNAAGFDRLQQDSGAKQLKNKLEEITKQAI
jgi:hypothetical protein